MADEELEVVMPSQYEVMLGLSRVEGQLSAFIQLMTSQGDAITHLTSEQSAQRDRIVKVESAQLETAGLRDRVVAIEAATMATSKASPPWWTWAAVLVPSVAFILSLAKDIYAK
jgi:hypothetical protein